MAEPRLPLPIFTDPLYRTGGLGGAAMLPVPITLPAGSTQTFSNVETTEQKRNKEYHTNIGNPFFIDFAGVVSPEQAARLGRGMIDFAQDRVTSSVSNIPSNLAYNGMKGELNPFNKTSFLKLGIDAVKATVGGTMTRGLATSIVGKAASSLATGAVYGAAIHPTELGGSTIDENLWRQDLYREQMREHDAKVKMIDEEYGKKMKGKYAGIEMLMETPMWKRDTSAQFTPEERKLQNYEEILIQRGQKVEAASRERAKLENGFYNDKGDFMSAHFARNSK
jgi:hypothetical protein